jgi:hypothetical protein
MTARAVFARRDALRLLGGACGLALAGAWPALADAADGAGWTGPSALERVKARGSLSVGLYTEMPPFHDAGKGIDADLGLLLAKALGVRCAPLPFPAGENMGDDLRNMVWKGHYLGYGPADVLLHVPVESPLMDANPQVRILAPYYRDRVVIARSLKRLPHLETMAQLNGQPIAVCGQSLAGWLVIGADGGAYAAQATTKWKDGVEAAQSLLRGECAAAAGNESELQAVLSGDDRFAVSPLPSPRAPRDGWAVGLAVKKDAGDLGDALQKAVDAAAADGRLKAIFAKARVAWRPV